MARYELPPDPRERFSSTRKRRLGIAQSIDWIAVVGLLLGLLITFIAIFIAWQAATSFLAREPLDVTPITEPTIIVLTAPPTVQAAENDEPPLPAVVVETAVPEEDEPSGTIELGVYAAVANTAGIGVTVRGGPSTDNVRLLLLDEGGGGLIVGGPQEGNGFTWWQLRLDDGTEGWVAADFLETADAPESVSDEESADE